MVEINQWQSWRRQSHSYAQTKPHTTWCRHKHIRYVLVNRLRPARVACCRTPVSKTRVPQSQRMKLAWAQGTRPIKIHTLSFSTMPLTKWRSTRTRTVINAPREDADTVGCMVEWHGRLTDTTILLPSKWLLPLMTSTGTQYFGCKCNLLRKVHGVNVMQVCNVSAK